MMIMIHNKEKLKNGFFLLKNYNNGSIINNLAIFKYYHQNSPVGLCLSLTNIYTFVNVLNDCESRA